MDIQDSRRFFVNTCQIDRHASVYRRGASKEDWAPGMAELKVAGVVKRGYGVDEIELWGRRGSSREKNVRLAMHMWMADWADAFASCVLRYGNGETETNLYGRCLGDRDSAKPAIM